MKKAILYCFILFQCICFAQGEANIWYFGQNAGIDFNSGSPVALTNGQLNTGEGCTTISNGAGQLLFYTDGVTVFNRNHTVMPNGTGLMGDTSSSQSSIVTPKPNSSNIYYIFTTPETVGSNGLRYSILDLNLDSGLGDITSQKNILLSYPVCEKLTAIKNATGDGFWVLAHSFGNNLFLAYTVNSSGINTTPVISNVGTIIQGNVDKSVGCLKFSPDGTKLLCANFFNDVQLFDFDASTGVVSNPKLVCSKLANYGVEFSPNGNIAYVTTGNYNVPTGNYLQLELLQYDLTASNIPNSETNIYTSTDVDKLIGALQIAIDGKIYIPIKRNPFVSTINNPDVLGVGCNFQLNGLNLGLGICISGLPQFIQSYFIASFNATNLCMGNTTNFSLTTSQISTSISWDFGDGSPTSSAVAPNHSYASAGTYNVTVTATMGGNTSTKSKNITISAVPIVATAVTNQTVCGSASATYNLASHSATLLGGQSTATYGVAYFTNATDLSNHANALATAYALPEGVTTIYAKVYNLNNTACFAQNSFTVTKYLQPIANNITDMVYCQTPYTGTIQFDLSTKNSEISGSQSATDFTVSYHNTQTDANNNTAALPTLYTNTLPIETIYARIENNLHTACYDTKSFQIKVISQPTTGTVTPYKICDVASNDGLALFDLSTKTTEVLNGQSSSTFVVRYYNNLPDANADVNPITAPINSTNTTVYYSITAISNSGCRVISSFNLQVNPLPKANTPTAIYMCDTGNDNVENFDLGSRTITILGTQNPANFTVSYHKLPTEAIANTNPLPSSYPNTSNPQTIYARVTNNQNTSCYDTTSFVIGLYVMPVETQPTDLTTCDDASNDGKESFNLGSQTATILGTQNPANFTVSYHATQPEANSGSNPLPSNYTNTTDGQQTIYIRLTNNLSASCFDASKSFTINVKAKPQIILANEFSICQGTFIDIPAPSGWSSYSWSKGSTVIGTLPTIRITVAGSYSLTVTKNYGTIICSDTKNFTVFNSNKATITNIETIDWTDSENAITVHVTGDGDYVYSLDNSNFQESNQFFGLASGQYFVYVKDKKDCGTVKEEVFLLMYPKFFTPNGDGYNDYWKIKFSRTEPNLLIKIFDRYGKLIKSMNAQSVGWDGNLNNNSLPSDDYWFVVIRENGKEYKGHFSIKR